MKKITQPILRQKFRQYKAAVDLNDFERMKEMFIESLQYKNTMIGENPFKYTYLMMSNLRRNFNDDFLQYILEHGKLSVKEKDYIITSLIGNKFVKIIEQILRSSDELCQDEYYNRYKSMADQGKDKALIIQDFFRKF